MLPEFLKTFFWSYKFQSLDKDKDKSLIIFNVLNFGDKASWDWLLKSYSKEEIKEAIKISLATEWFKTSLNLWQNMFDVKARPHRFPDMPMPKEIWPY
jgi:hypothetical protein